MGMFARRLHQGFAVAVLWVAGSAGLVAAESPTKQDGAVEPTVATQEADWAKTRADTFEVVWRTVNEAYFDATFGGVDWRAVGDRYRGRLPETADKAALRGLLQAMLGELRKTHFSILPREVSVFTPAERQRAGTVGAEVSAVSGGLAISELEPDSAAAKAGLRPGDVVTKIDRVEIAPLQDRLNQLGVSEGRRGSYLANLAESRLRGQVGNKTQLQVRDASGLERTVELTFEERRGEWSEPVGDLPSVPIVVRTLRSPEGLGYLHFNAFTRKAMKDIREFLLAMPADGGLVLDLRGNRGGLTIMASGISGWLSDHVFPLGTMHLREGQIGYTVNPQMGAFLGPVAVLIDHSSASTSEIMAAGLQEAGRARIFGETSPGAALPSLFKALPTGDLFQYAIADLQTPRGVLIEGRGVVPDEPVTRTAADLAAGVDPVRAAAERWLNTERHKPRPATASAKSTAP